MRLPRTAGVRGRTALADELGVGFVDSRHAVDHEFRHREGAAFFSLGDVGEPHGLLRLADGVDVRRGRLAEGLDGLLRFGGGGVVGFGHGCVGLLPFGTTILPRFGGKQ